MKMKSKAKTILRRRVPIQKRAAKSLALARRHVMPPAVVVPIGHETTLNDTSIAIGAFGTVSLKMTGKEETILSEAVKPEDVSIKPTGQPYLSHPVYTHWLNRAFGRGQWQLVPGSAPKKAGNSVACPYLLYVRGVPIAFAMGEQEYHENNPEQTYGDALEATVASALRRVAKRLGIGLELWNREWLQEFIDQHCVRVSVQVKKRGSDEKEQKWWWRRKDAKPFWQETKRAAAQRDEAVTDARPITQAQQKKLWEAARSAGRSQAEVAVWLPARFGVNETSKLRRDDFDFIIKCLEHPGSLLPVEAS